MGMTQDDAVRAAAEQFQVEASFAGAMPWGNGHIHDTYRVEFDSDGAGRHTLLQRMNHQRVSARA